MMEKISGAPHESKPHRVEDHRSPQSYNYVYEQQSPDRLHLTTQASVVLISSHSRTLYRVVSCQQKGNRAAEKERSTPILTINEAADLSRRPRLQHRLHYKSVAFRCRDGGILCISGDFPHSNVKEQDSSFVSCDNDSSDGG